MNHRLNKLYDEYIAYCRLCNIKKHKSYKTWCKTEEDKEYYLNFFKEESL